MAERRPLVGNLPADLTSFVARDEDLSRARRLLSESRLVTLTGVAGVGKSRLALRIAQQSGRAFPDGTWLVELSSLRDPALLPQAVGQALGLADTDGDPVRALSDALTRRRLLLVADNCEHLVPACRLLFTALLRAAPGLRVLVTSREVLKVPSEQVYEVAPLPVPAPVRSADFEEVVRVPAVVLFTLRAGEVHPGFAVNAENVDGVVAVCALSEGLPLFIELAAAQLRWLSPAQLADRLADRFRLLTRHSSAVLPRHQTLHAAVEWSFALCSHPERLAWVRASVFAGRFDLQAAQRVCAGDGLPSDELLDVLAGLIDKSVLQSAERDGVRRYWMLDTLRAYGLENLRSPQAGDRYVIGESELRRRHRDYFLGLAERFNADWFGPRQMAWSRRMRAELAELRAALAFCLSTPGEASAAVRLAGTLSYFWWGCSAAREGSLWLERALAADPSPTPDRARALAVYARTLTARSLHAEAAEPARECLELARRFDDPALLSEALSDRGLNLMQTGDLTAALPLLDEAIERATTVPDIPIALALATVCRGAAAIAAGDPVRADDMAARSQDVCRTHGDRWWLNYALSLSIPSALMLGDAARATAYGRESLAGCAALGDTLGLTLSLEYLAWTANAEGDHGRSARLLGAADRQARVNGGNPTTAGPYGPTHEHCEATARVALGDVRFDAEFRSGADLSLDEAIAYANGHGRTPERRPARPSAPPRDDPPHLTKREFEIARLLAKGLTNKQIAHQLVIAQRTAESHVENILSKLGFTTRTQIATWMLTRETADRVPDGPGVGRVSPWDIA